MAKRSLIFVGLLTVAIGAGCHGRARPSVPEPLEPAAIHTDGPVPLPGQDFSVPQVMGTDGEPLVVPSIPPGSLMRFPRPVARVPDQILIRRHSAGETDSAAEVELWTLEPVLLPTRGGKRNQSVVGFEIPQLPKGIYDVWYVGERPGSAAKELLEPAAPDASQWTTLEIRPLLEAAESVVHGQPGTIVEVAIGFHGPAIDGTPTPVTLSGFSKTVRLAPGQPDQMGTRSDGLARFKVRIEKESDVYLAATAPGFAPVAVRVVGGPERPLRDHRLRPGDVLLCQGNSLISDAIQVAERMQLGQPNRGGRPWYSHVALYLGNGETAEMLDAGLVTHTLARTIDGCTTLDVYRRDGVTPEEQNSVVEQSKYGRVPYGWGQIAAIGSMAIIANTDRVRLSGAESWWDSFFGAAKALTARAIGWAVRTATTFVLGADEGRSGMICSEFVAWSYHDADVRLNVAPWWPVVENAGLLSSLFGRMDFTTPNMIAQSPDLSFQFQLYPKVPAEVEVAECQVRLGEKIEFETGSAIIGEDDEDLLEAVANVLASQPEIERIRIEGNTDDVGAAEKNQQLSQQRADAVMSWFVAHGVDPTRLSSMGLGESHPLMPNDSVAHRHQNRRVEFHVENQTCEAANRAVGN